MTDPDQIQARDTVDGSVDDDRAWMVATVRATAIALVVLLPVHLVSFHVIGSDRPLTASLLAERWSGPWRLLDWATLVLALVHGAFDAAVASRPGSRPGSRSGSQSGSASGAGSTSRWRAGLATAAVVSAAVAIGAVTYVAWSYELT